MATWLAGILGGVVVVYIAWDGFLMTGIHGKVALVMLPIIFFGFFSGLQMNHKKKRRTFLPLVHGLVNLIVLVLALYQILTGWWVYNDYVLG
jgi:hypothetical protein